MIEHTQARQRITKILKRDNISLDELLTRPVLGKTTRRQAQKMLKEAKE